MNPNDPAQQWNQRYLAHDLPWDSGNVDHNLMQTLAQWNMPRDAACEIGCGTGTNAIAIAQSGFHRVIATDFAAHAIELAKNKSLAAGVKIDFQVHDILSDVLIPGVAAASLDFVFDRGVFHSVSEDQRRTFAKRVVTMLKPGGWWLSLCGSADDTTEGGPPRLTAAQIAAVVEPLFEIHTLCRGEFLDVSAEMSSVYSNWRVLMRRRS